MKGLRWVVPWLIVLASACGSGRQIARPAPFIYVFAASFLPDALGRFANTFEAEQPGAKLALNSGASKSLRTPSEQGAPADVFIWAGATDMNTLVDEGFGLPDAPRILLADSLVVILATQNPAAIQRLMGLARPQIKLVLTAVGVPLRMCGRQSLQMMERPLETSAREGCLRTFYRTETT